MSGELAAYGAKVAPPIAVAGLTVVGLTLQEWVYVMTILYTGIQTVITLSPKIAPKLAAAWAKLRSLWAKSDTSASA